MLSKLDGLGIVIAVCAGTMAGTLTGLLMCAALGVFEPVEITHTPKPQFGTTPPNCGDLFDVGKSKEWSACMLVPHVLPVETRRDDI